MDLVNVACHGTNSLSVHFHDSCRNSHSRAVIGDRTEHDRIRCDLDIVTDSKRTEYLCSRADQNIVPESRVTLALVLASTAERYALIQQAVVSHDRSLADDNAHSVVDEQPLSDSRSGVYLNSRAVSGAL